MTMPHTVRAQDTCNGLAVLKPDGMHRQKAARIILPVMHGPFEVARITALVQSNDHVACIQAKDLSPWVEETMSLESARAFAALADTDGIVRLSQIPKAGFRLVYDESDVVLRISTDPAHLQGTSLSMTGMPEQSLQPPLETATVSGFVNFRGGQDYIHDAPQQSGRQPLRLELDGAVNVKGWVVEGRADYIEDNKTLWRRGNVRMVHDAPDKMLRLAAGDLSYPVSGFQSFTPMAGVSLARNFSLQPYRVTEPSGQTSFVLQTSSRVEVLVNGQRIRTLQLDPGPYDISDFPVTDGSNDVVLRITDATGHMEEKRFSFLGGHTLLRAGLHEYAYNAGVRSQNTGRRISYQTETPVFSAFHRVGLNDKITLGATLQADKNAQQAGLSAATPLLNGITGIDTAVSHNRYAGEDIAAKISYNRQNPETGRSFLVTAEYKGENFSQLIDGPPSNPTQWEFSAGHYRRIPGNIMAGIGGRYKTGRGHNDDKWSYSLSLGKTISSALSMNINGQHQNTDGIDVFASLTWSPHVSSHTITSSIDTSSRTQALRWNWRDGRTLQTGAEISREHGHTRGSGHAAWRANRVDASLHHDANLSQSTDTGSPLQQRTQIRLGTALAFADGRFAVSRPIDNSFILVTRHDNLKDHAIGINPQKDENGHVTYETRIDRAGPAVIPDMTPYFYKPIRIDTSTLPAGYDIGQDNFIGLPAYKTGTHISVGSAANIYADGYILQEDGTPLSLSGGTIMPTSGSGQAQEFFTNRKGRFRIIRLSAGTYNITMHDRPDTAIPVSIPKGTPFGRYDAGTLTMPQEKRSTR